MTMSSFNVAIIGGGLSGLALALALRQQAISCTIYEAHGSPLNTGGGLMLTPNGLKVLRALGVYEAIVKKSYTFKDIYVQHGPSGKIVEQIEYGSDEKYGTNALRAYRFVVLEELLAKVRSSGIPIELNRKFSHVTRETQDSIDWHFTDGTLGTASLLIGTDGIHSTVRKHVAPGIEPKYGGALTIVGAVPTAQLELPAQDYEDLTSPTNRHPLPTGILVPQYGGFIISPQTKSGDEVMITVLRQFPQELERWSELDKDKDRLRAMFRENAAQFPDVVRNAVKDIPDKSLIAWPGYSVPRLERWYSAETNGSKMGRAIVLGDAAHAFPPSGGQGVNQAFEDVYTFAGVLGKVEDRSSNAELQNVLASWQSWRQERLDIAMRILKQMEIRRLPAAAQAKVGNGADPETLQASMSQDFDALFKVNYSDVISECLRKAREIA